MVYDYYMDETRRFKERLQQLKDLNTTEIITSEKLFSFKEIKTELELILKSVDLALNYPDFVSELPAQDASQISGELEGVI